MKIRMIAVFLTMALLATTSAMGFQSREFSETVPFASGDRLTIDTYKGSIHVSTWERSEISIFARISPPEGEDAGYAAEVVEATRVEVRRSNGRSPSIPITAMSPPSGPGGCHTARTWLLFIMKSKPLATSSCGSRTTNPI